MTTLSSALPIKFWAYGVSSFNDGGFGFVLSRPYYHELLDSDSQKLQLTDDADNVYYLYFLDEQGNLITSIPFVKTTIGTLKVFDINWTFTTLPVAISEKRIRMYIVKSPSTFDDTFDYTFQTDVYAYRTDLIDVRSSISYNMGWGSVLLSYKSLTNYYGIQYPNDGNYFNLRIPARFYAERIQETVNEIQLSDNVLATSRTQKFQNYLEPYQLPAYVYKTIAAALSHDVTGSVKINGIEYEASDGFDWTPVDAKSPLFKGKVWLTDKFNFVRNII